MTGLEEKVTVVETTIDDMSPEIYSFLFDKLIKDGALDVYVIPVYMKKNRPANLLCVICHEEKLEVLLETVFRETSTLGVRLREEKRRILYRNFEQVDTLWGKVTIKTGFASEDKKEILQAAPEYEECRSISEKFGVPLQKVYTAALLAFEKLKD